MNLVIDTGNTTTKVAVFKDDNLIHLSYSDNLTIQEIEALGYYNSVKRVIVSAVGEFSKEVEAFLTQKFFYIRLTKDTRTPIENLYKSPSTLGSDRLAAAIGAKTIVAKKNILIIDAGTCITYDIINKKAEYLGGGISPGIDIRFKALHTFTEKLPLVIPKDKNEQIELVGTDTENSILSGVLNGVLREVEGTIESYKDEFSGLIVFVTGGHFNFFETKLKSKIFAQPNLVLTGLNTILNYNAV